MFPDPQPMDHRQRLELARTIAGRLHTRYHASVKAIGLYGSVARGQDGPYSDIEMFCVLKGAGDRQDYEWCVRRSLFERDARRVFFLTKAAITGEYPL